MRDDVSIQGARGRKRKSGELEGVVVKEEAESRSVIAKKEE